jgi:large subunit ribosomal protein L3
VEKNGYNAIVIASDGFAKSSSVNKPQKVMLEKNSCPVVSELKEFRLPDSVNMSEFKLGNEISINLEDLLNSFVDTLSVAKGKGFAGVMKKYGFKGQPATHGVSLTHRSIGSTGNRTDPGKVFKNKKMPSRMGGKNVRKQNMKIIGFDGEKSLLYILGSIPGFNGSRVIVESAIKKSININSKTFVFNSVSSSRLS